MSDPSTMTPEPIRYWFLAYQTVYKTPNREGLVMPPDVSNTVLADVHPLIWLSTHRANS
jgi:hypothetical protein